MSQFLQAHDKTPSGSRSETEHRPQTDLELIRYPTIQHNDTACITDQSLKLDVQRYRPVFHLNPKTPALSRKYLEACSDSKDKSCGAGRGRRHADRPHGRREERP